MPRRLLGRATYYLAFGSAVSILFSIAASQILLALALVALLFSREKLRIPPIRLPLAIFFLITLAALLASSDPARGMPQLRKFFVFAIVVVIFSTFRSVRQVQALIMSWAVVGAASALLGIAQFLRRHHEALAQNADNYGFYVYGRITGFESHWMTFGGEEMIVILMLVAILLFSDRPRWKLCLWPIAVLMWAAVGLSMTRSIFLLGLPLGIAYLAWQRRKVFVVVFLAGSATGIAFAPAAVRERAVSAFKPHSDIDSNAQRALCRTVGWQMVKAHPWLGLGPEQISIQFDRYVPASVGHPLPPGWYGHLHNVSLQYAAERGVFGLLSFLWLIGAMTFDFIRALRQPTLTSESRAVLNGAIAVIIAVLTEGFFEHNLGDSEILTVFLAVISCGYVVARQARAPRLVESPYGSVAACAHPDAARSPADPR